jgi:hypothetical protein
MVLEGECLPRAIGQDFEGLKKRVRQGRLGWNCYDRQSKTQRAKASFLGMFLKRRILL